MFSVLLTAVIAICADPNETTPVEPNVAASALSNVEILTSEGIPATGDNADLNCIEHNFPASGFPVRGYGSGSGICCGCIRSSANYPWNWLCFVKRICHLPQNGRYDLPPGGKSNCPAYYGLYDRPYNYRRSYDYPWRSPAYRPRNVASRGAIATKDCIDQFNPGDVNERLDTAAEVLVLPEPQDK